ncbi:MAG: DNA repair protein RecO [Flavobacteriales bacterium]|nr:DNA repair protein RecO [Flavobacteriales bacterium]
MSKKTNIIVLKLVPYTSGTAIMKGLSPDMGQLAFFVRGMGNKKAKNQILSHAGAILDVEYTEKQGTDLLSVSQLERLVHYQNVPGDVVKSSLMLFLAEIILKSTQQNDGSREMYQLAVSTFEWIDVSDRLANIHLYFLANWIKLLGLQPQQTQDVNQVFDLQEGAWLSEQIAPVEGRVLSADDAKVFIQAFDLRMTNLDHLSLSGESRRRLLHALVNYLCFQLSIGKGITSLSIIELLFDEK